MDTLFEIDPSAYFQILTILFNPRDQAYDFVSVYHDEIVK